MKRRFKPAVRKEQIIKAALELAHEHRFDHVSRNMIADKVGVAGPTVQYHFGTMQQLRRALMREALKLEDLKILAQIIAARDPYADKIPSDLKARALATLV